MLRKLSITLILLLLIGCSNLPTKDDSLTLEEKSLISKINHGEVNKAQELLTEIEKTLKPEKVENYQTLISEKTQEINELENLINILKVAFSKNHFFIIEQYTDMSIKNRVKLNELKKLDLSQANIFTSKPKFDNNNANVLAVINFYDESMYLDIFFEYKNGKWKIKNFSERG